jgi:hypothetical protein
LALTSRANDEMEENEGSRIKGNGEKEFVGNGEERRRSVARIPEVEREKREGGLKVSQNAVCMVGRHV